MAHRRHRGGRDRRGAPGPGLDLRRGAAVRSGPSETPEPAARTAERAGINPLSIAGELARFLARTNVTDLPPLALERARMVIASTIASAAMGVDIVSSRIIRELARERAGAPEATVWFDGGGALPVADAARVNAVMSDAAASDDSELRSIAHIGTLL